jgi:hypothetical protein
VIVPDEMLPAILEWLRPVAVPLDPYRDSTISGVALGQVANRMREGLEARRTEIVRQVSRELRAREVPAWATSMVDARIRDDELATMLSDLLALCERAILGNRILSIKGP